MRTGREGKEYVTHQEGVGGETCDREGVDERSGKSAGVNLMDSTHPEVSTLPRSPRKRATLTLLVSIFPRAVLLRGGGGLLLGEPSLFSRPTPGTSFSDF